MNKAICTKAGSCGTVKDVAALIDQISTEAEWRGKAMDLKSRDIVDKVILKLSVLDDLFAFYSVVHDKIGFQQNSIDGLSFIISDCVEELKEAAK
jgi:hypothetical protein